MISGSFSSSAARPEGACAAKVRVIPSRKVTLETPCVASMLALAVKETRSQAPTIQRVSIETIQFAFDVRIGPARTFVLGTPHKEDDPEQVALSLVKVEEPLNPLPFPSGLAGCFLAKRCLRGRESGDRHAIGRAGYVIEPDPFAEGD